MLGMAAQNGPTTLLDGLDLEDEAILGRALSKVHDLMTREPVCLRPEAPVADAIGLFTERKFRHLLVRTGGALAGVLSDRDVLRHLARHQGAVDTPVAKVMTRDPVTIGPGASVADGISLLIHQRINCLPVVEHDAALEGILTTTDLLRALYAMVYWLERRAASPAR